MSESSNPSSQIGGNASEKIKVLSQRVFAQFISAKGKSYGAEVGEKLKLMEINVHGLDDVGMGVGTKKEGVGNEVCVETVFEVVVDKDMCNIYGTLHGACAAYLVDPCSSSPLVILGFLLDIDGTGVSQSMNLIWHQPIPCGAKITIKSTSMFITGRIRTARCEIWDQDKLCISAIHSTINPNTTKSTQVKL